MPHTSGTALTTVPQWPYFSLKEGYSMAVAAPQGQIMLAGSLPSATRF